MTTIHLWRGASKREAEFRAARPIFEKMLLEKGWRILSYKNIHVIEQPETGTMRAWFLSNPKVFRLGDDFILMNPDGFDIYFRHENPFKTVVWENQKQINAIVEDEKKIVIHYSKSFALVERLEIEKDLKK